MQDLPDGIRTIQDISNDFVPQSLGNPKDLIERIRNIFPEIDFTDPSCGKLDGEGFSIEINIGDEELVGSFALHIRGDDRAPYVVHHLLANLHLRALDPSSVTGIFSLEEGSAEGFARWEAYRSSVLGRGSA